MTINTPAHQNVVLMIGGPDAGKSNFLFRLWIALSNGKGALQKNGLPEEVQYLQSGADHLLEGKFAGRTSKEVHEHVYIPLKTATGEEGVLAVPDVAGEQVLAVYKNRQWSAAWEDRISENSGCLMFVRAASEEIVAPLDWAMCFEKYGGIPPISKSSEQTAPGAILTSDALKLNGNTPTQVVLTDWLQFLHRAFAEKVTGGFRPRVGIVVAAWDAVPKEQQDSTPSKYIQDNFPMLYQFVEANGDIFDFHFFGISIVAGDLENDDDFKTTYSQGVPQEFGFVIHAINGQREKSDDMTLPVAWALGLIPPHVREVK